MRVLVAAGYRAVPVSAALLAVSEHYYSTFAEYIRGNISHPIEVHALCLAAATAAINAHLADRDQLLEDWHASLRPQENDRCSCECGTRQEHACWQRWKKPT